MQLVGVSVDGLLILLSAGLPDIGIPVSVGMNYVLITFSRCWKWLLRFGRMWDK